MGFPVDELHVQASQFNRKLIGEAVITLAVGVVLCVLIFGGVFWISYVILWMTHPFGIRHIALAALGITIVFALASLWSAWRRSDPISRVEAMDQSRQNLQLGLGYAMGLPVVNRQSLAGLASLLIGGPANVMESVSIWCSRLPTDSAFIARTAKTLQDSRDGLAAQSVGDPRVIVVLHRLGLIKATSHGLGKIELQPTAKGMELLASID